MSSHVKYDITFAVNIVKLYIDDLIKQHVDNVIRAAPDKQTMILLLQELNDGPSDIKFIDSGYKIVLFHRGVELIVNLPR